MASFGSIPGAIAVPSGRTRQSSIRNTSSRSTATGSLSRTTSAYARDGRCLAIAEEPEVAEKGASMAQRHLLGHLEQSGRQGLDFRGAIDSAPIEHREMAAHSMPIQPTSTISPRLNLKSGFPSPQTGVAGAPGRSVRLSALPSNCNTRATLREPGRSRHRARGRPRRVRPSVRVDPAGIWGLPSDQCGPFFVVPEPSCDALPRCCQKGPFFCCGGVGSCYKPAARGIAAGYGCFSRGRGGTGRRAGFRFQ